VQERLNALARAQEMVLPSTAGDAERSTTLHSLIRTIVSPYEDPADSASSRIELRGCDTEIAGRAVTGFALLLHEFATNAAKYGALSASDGRVEIDCTEEGDSFVVLWRERGGPAVDPDNGGNGFGSVLARATVRGQLRGELSKEWHPDGLTIRLSTPKERLLA
jgi:two-component sensor histidine kinase